MTTQTQPSFSIVGAKVIDGGLAGITGVTATFPLDLSKTRLQKQKIIQGQAPKYKGMFHAMKVVMAEEGIKGLYSGYKVNVSFIIFEKAFKLVGNDVLRMNLTNKQTGKITLWNECLAGSGAGFMQSCVTTPMELIKIKGQLAASQGKEFSTINGWRNKRQ